MSGEVSITLTVNGSTRQSLVEPRLSLADFLRVQLGLTGTHLGCEMGACGACLAKLDGRAVHSCLLLAVQADGRSIETIEGLSETGAIADLQTAFVERNALQCGFCTSGILITAHECISLDNAATREQIRDALSGNYCRCTGYEAIVDAIENVALKRRLAAEGQS